MKTDYVKWLIIISLIFSTVNARADNYWFSLGLGGTNRFFEEHTNSGVKAGIMATYQKEPCLFTLECDHITEFHIDFGKSPLESVFNLDLVVSRYYKKDNSLLSAGVGPSLFRFVRRGEMIEDHYPSASEYETQTSWHPGAALDLQCLIFGSKFGIGAKYSVHVNPHQNFTSYLVFLSFGHIL